MKSIIAAILFAAVVPALFAGGYIDDAELVDDSFYSNYIANRFSIGVSYAVASMRETSTPHENAYLGNLDTLDEDSMGAFGIVVRYDFCDYVGIEFSNDFQANLDAYNWGSASCDGTLKLSGYRIQLNFQYPFSLQDVADFTEDWFVVPYVGIGFYNVSASWDHASWWHWGWASPEDYDTYANGEQAPHNHYSRWMLPEDPGFSPTITVGVGFKMFDCIGLDLFYRYIAIDDVETDFRTGSSHGHLMRDGAFPAKCDQFGAMLRYVF